MTVMSLTGLDPVADRATVVAALKVRLCIITAESSTDRLGQRNKQNVETVIGLYFDNPDSVCSSPHGTASRSRMIVQTNSYGLGRYHVWSRQRRYR